MSQSARARLLNCLLSRLLIFLIGCVGCSPLELSQALANTCESGASQERRARAVVEQFGGAS